MIENQIDKYAKILWDYLQLHQAPVKSDIIFCLCSHDTRVAKRAAQLMLDGLGDYLIFSGGAGRFTRDMFDKPEAEVFAGIAEQMGVPRAKIITENESTNTGENVRLTYDLLGRRSIKADTLLLVQKPYTERRTYATFKKQWPRDDVVVRVTSPRASYEEYVNDSAFSKGHILNAIVGDMQRMREYPRLGYQIEQEIPDNVWQAYEELVKQGFHEHLIES